MRASLVLIALGLAACGKAGPAPDNADTESYRKAELAEYRYLVGTGVPPAEARQRILSARDLARKLDDDPEAIWREANRQEEIAAVRADQCRREPWRSDC
jgi:hypothetical protein